MAAFQGPDIPLIGAVTIDCTDLGLADFWSKLLSVQITHRDDQWAFLGYAPDRKVTVWFQKVPEDKVVENRVHLDLAVQDLEATASRILAMGGASSPISPGESTSGRHLPILKAMSSTSCKSPSPQAEPAPGRARSPVHP